MRQVTARVGGYRTMIKLVTAAEYKLDILSAIGNKAIICSKGRLNSKNACIVNIVDDALIQGYFRVCVD